MGTMQQPKGFTRGFHFVKYKGILHTMENCKSTLGNAKFDNCNFVQVLGSDYFK